MEPKTKNRTIRREKETEAEHDSGREGATSANAGADAE